MNVSPTRVTIDARYLRTQHSGIGRYTEKIIEHLLEIAPHLSLHLLTHPERPAPFEEHARVRHTVFDAQANSIATRAKLAKLVHDTSPDLYHSPFNFLPAKLAPELPRIFTLHDIMWLIHPEYCTSSRARRTIQGTFYKHVISRSIEEATRILTVSHFSREEIVSYAPQMRGKVDVSYNGIDPYFHEPLEAWRAWETISARVPPRKKFVLIVGQGSPYKNHQGALEAFIRAFEHDPDVYLVLVRRFSRGTSPELKRLLRHRALNSRLITLDYVSVEELRALYHAASCFLFPSIYEGFGIPPLEAMACGTPVVAGDVGAPAEVCGEGALLVDPYDPSSIAAGLREMVFDEASREAMIRRGHRRAAQFTWERCARQVLEAYDRTLATSSSPLPSS